MATTHRRRSAGARVLLRGFAPALLAANLQRQRDDLHHRERDPLGGGAVHDATCRASGVPSTGRISSHHPGRADASTGRIASTAIAAISTGSIAREWGP
ncbi:hypothetical protein [Nannocystis exedens]|uniref:hypothetical protein n=1 Tax=Nannocystis exedens TaxID=54 RepID=UPI000BBA027A|nr:hypothetical protein [Nannocystis exedens]